MQSYRRLTELPDSLLTASSPQHARFCVFLLASSHPSSLWPFQVFPIEVDLEALISKTYAELSLDGDKDDDDDDDELIAGAPEASVAQTHQNPFEEVARGHQDLVDEMLQINDDDDDDDTILSDGWKGVGDVFGVEGRSDDSHGGGYGAKVDQQAPNDSLDEEAGEDVPMLQS